MAKTQLSSVDKGRGGQPGSDYTDRIARVYRVRPGRYELYVRAAHGSHQGWCGARELTEQHDGRARTYRAGSIDDLMRIGISEVRDDADLLEYCGADGVGQLVAAIREACIAAEDAEAESEVTS